jgi:hypothetical protein
MSIYAFEYQGGFVNTGLVLVGSGLTRGTWGTGLPASLSPLPPKVNLLSPELFYTTGNGGAGFLRFYPTTNYKAAAPPSIPDSETIYIEWDIPETGVPNVKVTAPKLYKVSATIVSAALKLAAEGSFGPGTCLPGYVWREAFPGDKVCVLPAIRAQAAADNEEAGSRAGADGRCMAGFVWREAKSSDHVCVLPATRTQAAADNKAAESREL